MLRLVLSAFLLVTPCIAKPFTWSYTSDVQTLDPHVSRVSFTNAFLANVYETLVRMDDRLAIQPALATGWEQPSPTTWQFRIRTGVRFHNGDPFTADDVVFSWERLGTPGANRGAMAAVKSIRVVGDDTIEVETTRPFPLLLNALLQFPIGRRHGTLFHQDGHRSGSLDMAGRMFGLLGPDALMSHCTDLTEADIEAVVSSGTRIVHNPSAIASVRGYCPVPELLDRGVLVIIGSDGTAPDRSTDMFRHMFQCMRLHQRQYRDERLMPPGKLLEMVTVDAARALHMEAEIGSLETGKRADVITVDLRKPHLAPANMPIWRLVCFANGQDVDTVIVDGRVLMQGRIVPHVDVSEVLAQADAETNNMLDRTGFRPMLAEPATIWGSSRH